MNAAFSKRERVHRNVPLLVLFSRAPHHFEKKATDVRKQGLPPTKVTTRTLFTCLTHHESVISPPSSGPLRTIAFQVTTKPLLVGLHAPMDMATNAWSMAKGGLVHTLTRM